MISLDGSTLEGGGQLVRVAFCLAAICRIPIRIDHIRANRAGRKQDGGLKESHLAALDWLADQCGAKVTGAEIGSREVVFKPKASGQFGSTKRNATIELKRPGSVWLIWQAIFPFIIFNAHQMSGREQQLKSTPSEMPAFFDLTLKGGTNVSKSMSHDYAQQVLLPICQKIGLPPIKVDLVKRGWAGLVGEVGEVKISVPTNISQPFVLPGFNAGERGPINKITITVVADGEQVRRMLKQKATVALQEALGKDIEIEIAVDEDSGDERRLYLLLIAHTEQGWRLGSDHLGSGRKARHEAERGKLVDLAVKGAVKQLQREIKHGGCVDEYLQDQLVVFQALAQGRSCVDGGEGKAIGSLHTQTVRWVCEQMLAGKGLRFDADAGCEGIGWNAEKGEEGKSVDGLSSKIEDMTLIEQD